MDSLLKQFAQSSQLGANAAYIEDLYEQYLAAPESVGPKWQQYFDGLKGRLLSASYMPNEGDPKFEPMIKDLTDIFAKHERGGKITILYDTNVFYTQF